MLTDVNAKDPQRNAALESKGYGYLPFKAVLDSSSPLLYDASSKTQYELECAYAGARLNLFNEGTTQESVDLLYGFAPSLEKGSDKRPRA